MSPSSCRRSCCVLTKLWGVEGVLCNGASCCVGVPSTPSVRVEASVAQADNACTMRALWSWCDGVSASTRPGSEEAVLAPSPNNNSENLAMFVQQQQ